MENRELITENAVVENAAGIPQLILAEGAAAKEYFKAEAIAISAAEAQLQKAKSLKERQYWYEKMEQHTAALGTHNETVIYLVVGLVIFGICMGTRRE